MNIDKEMEQAVVSGVTYDKNQVKISVFGIPDKPGIAARLFDAFACKNINVDMIVQNVGEGGIAAISFTIKNEDLSNAKKVIQDIKDKLEIKEIAIDTGICKSIDSRRWNEDTSGCRCKDVCMPW
jgi:aspartate kinase